VAPLRPWENSLHKRRKKGFSTHSLGKVFGPFSPRLFRRRAAFSNRGVKIPSQHLRVGLVFKESKSSHTLVGASSLSWPQGRNSNLVCANPSWALTCFINSPVSPFVRVTYRGPKLLCRFKPRSVCLQPGQEIWGTPKPVCFLPNRFLETPRSCWYPPF